MPRPDSGLNEGFTARSRLWGVPSMGFTVSLIDSGFGNIISRSTNETPPLVDTAKPTVSTVVLDPLVRIVPGQRLELGIGAPI